MNSKSHVDILITENEQLNRMKISNGYEFFFQIFPLEFRTDSDWKDKW